MNDESVLAEDLLTPQRMVLLSKDRTILERPFMEFRPFGLDERGEKIRDLSGVSVAIMVEYLEKYVARDHGPAAGTRAVEELCRLVNGRIRDPVYHVTPAFLKNTWHSYSCECGAYLYEFCQQLSGDQQFAFHSGKEKASPVMQVLARPFSLPQIYSMFPYFAEKYGALECRVVNVTRTSAILAMRFTERTYQQFGPYRKRCAFQRCESAKGIVTAVPERVHGLPPAVLKERSCIADGDEWCEWEVAWTPAGGHGFVERCRELWSGNSAGPRQDQGVAGAALETPHLPSDLPHAGAQRGPQETGGTQGREESELLSKDHTILERPFMEFPPFGAGERGQKIADVSGMIVKDNLEYLEEHVARVRGAEAGSQVAAELCRLLNERIRDSAFHVTPAFLKNVWNSYSYEFVAYVREFCRQLSGDPEFHAHVGKEKHISPLIQTLGRPFSLPQIHKMYPYFAQKFAKGLECSVVEVTDRSAILRLRYPEHVYRQFGPYRKACVAQTCESSKARIAMVPPRLHGLPASTVRDRSCIVNGDDYCEWEVRWNPEPRHDLFWPTWGLLVGAAAFVYLHLLYPSMSVLEAMAIAVGPAVVSWLGTSRRVRQSARGREAVIEEQVRFVEARHEDLREAYLEQERTRVELRRKVNQLTTLHRAGLLFGSMLGRDALLQKVLQALVGDLHYDRAMISLFDAARQVVYETHVLGVSDEVERFARSREIPVTDPDSPEGQVLLQGLPLLVADIESIKDRLHPINRQLAAITCTKSLIVVPLKIKDRVMGSVTVDRMLSNSLTQDDLEVMVTVANQVAIALDNTSAYQQIEEMNVGLEAKVRERTAELERADRLKSLFISHVSHELRTPLTSLKGYIENLTDGIAGPLNEKLRAYLTRMGANTERLIRMIEALLDRTRIEAGKLHLEPSDVDLHKTVTDVLEQLRPLAAAKRQQLEACYPETLLVVWADADRLIQILTNLVHNAIKYTPDGGHISVKIAREGPASARLVVKDTGPGIPPEALPKIFDPFFRVSQEHRGGPKGLGLGLSIVKSLVELHGGTIQVRSEVGKGAEFELTLPLSPTLELPLAPQGTKRKRVLVVDDDPDIRLFLHDRLKSRGYEVEIANDGHQALELLQAGTHDGLILDIGMPDMDGLEVLSRIRERDARIPVVMVTASGSKDRAIQAVSRGAQAYVLKPFDLTELQRVVEYWFGHPSPSAPDALMR